MYNNTKKIFKKLNSLYSNFKGKIYLKEKEEKIEPTFFNFDVEDVDFIYEKVFLDNNDFIKVLKELNLEYNPSLTIQENLQFLKEKGKIVNIDFSDLSYEGFLSALFTTYIKRFPYHFLNNYIGKF